MPAASLERIQSDQPQFPAIRDLMYIHIQAFTRCQKIPMPYVGEA